MVRREAARKRTRQHGGHLAARPTRCYAPPDRPATMTYFITIAGRRWPVEETFKTGKDVLGWDQSQIRSFPGICRHTALTALAQLRHTAIRNALHGDITLAPHTTSPDTSHPPSGHDNNDNDVDESDLVITLGQAPVPTRGGQPCPKGIGLIKLSIAETARLTRLAQQHATGTLTRTRLAFALRWSTRRRRHQATARWHHYNTRLLAAAT